MDAYIRNHEDDFIGQAEESLPIKSCRRLSELFDIDIDTGWNYNIPPKYMIYECTLAVRNFKSLFTIRVILPLQNHSHYRRSHHRNQHHILLHTQAHTPSFSSPYTDMHHRKNRLVYFRYHHYTHPPVPAHIQHHSMD